MSPPVRRALLSVSDKTGLLDFARALAARGIELVSTGGTAGTLKAEGLAVTDVAAVTGFPEIMDGRVKTLHPKIHGGLLADRGNAEHVKALSAQAIAPFELLVVNLYPFEQVTAKAGTQWDEAIENIDIGGPAMIRAAAKNHGSLAVIVDPSDYDEVLKELDAHQGAVSEKARRRFAAKAFARTASYDAAIAQWFARELKDDAPDYAALGGRLIQKLRYGENPHQSAAFYKSPENREGVATARQLQGKELSYNNINDTDAAFECVAEFGAADAAACVIVKHANPCGVALGASLCDAYRKALACDPVSAFGGIIAFNRPIDEATAEEITKIFTEVIIAPGATDEARAIIAQKKNLRLLVTEGLPDPKAHGTLFKTVAGGFLVQSRDAGHVAMSDLKVVTKRAPSVGELADLQFAFTVAKHVKSNAIVYAKGRATVGIGAGQMSRVDSTRIAAAKSAEAAKALGLGEPLARGAVVASDAFFPFADGLITAAEAGVTAVIQPGGSLRDADVIKAADELGLAMVFTGMRHFRH
ncbi:bifunctional phosphoribosylaminoimidazolecarboxamide formyltransferase/IMP cyclohydrolase [Taklimakanibacter lacteus]|uniref:bifunctional phosphoribosylaminoimidazolecarboxamide formyltransferase/IMP cyclohydrolase n=1 Tax=Taklimakanibacter lacteus TaxID=2268456 RepID=UPI000E67461C